MAKSVDPDQTPRSAHAWSFALVLSSSIYSTVSGADPGGFLMGFDLIILPYLLYVFGQIGLSKQCRPKSDAEERGVRSGSTPFTTYLAILHTFTGSKMDLYFLLGFNDTLALVGHFVSSPRDLLKRCIRKSVPNLSNLSKISQENEILSQSGVRLNPRNPSESAPEYPSIL